ncbi:hypothetical protein LN050_05635 [Comamonadaceae bacterium M7527]|nr:hypothetical protein LN050_05635 [Comamonadaceae bacterium M7527]
MVSKSLFARRAVLALCASMSSLAVLPLAALAADKPELRVVAHDSFNLPKELLADFEQRNGVTVRDQGG